MILCQRGSYDAFKEDIAVVNIFFGKREMTGKITDHQLTDNV